MLEQDPNGWTGDGNHVIAARKTAADHASRIEIRQAVGKELGKEKVDDVVDRDQRSTRAPGWKHVMGGVEENRGGSAGCASLIAQSSDGVDRRTGRMQHEILRQTGERFLALGTDEEHVSVVIVDFGQSVNQLTNIGADSKSFTFPGIDADGEEGI